MINKKINNRKQGLVSIDNSGDLTKAIVDTVAGLLNGTIDGKTATTVFKGTNSIAANGRNQINHLKAIGSKKPIKFFLK